MFRFKVPLDQMPDKSPATLRRLSDEDLFKYHAGWRPGTAEFLTANNELIRRQGHPAFLISLVALAVTIVALMK